MHADVKSYFIFSKASFCSISQSHFLFFFNSLFNGSIIVIPQNMAGTFYTNLPFLLIVVIKNNFSVSPIHSFADKGVLQLFIHNIFFSSKLVIFHYFKDLNSVLNLIHLQIHVVKFWKNLFR